MKTRLKICLSLLISAFGLQAALAQDSGQTDAKRVQGYVFVAPSIFVDGISRTRSALHTGAGGEFLVYKGLGVGTEIGYFTPWSDWSSGLAIWSLDGSYHFTRNRRLSPFVTGGYSLGFRSRTANLINFGGGVNYWFRSGSGIRLEFRDNVNTEYFRNLHYISFRIGYSFR